MISFRHLALRRGSRTLLSRMDLTIQTGWSLGVIGRNGCGKSTLFAALKGELEPEVGDLDMPSRIRLASVATALELLASAVSRRAGQADGRP